MRRDMLDTFEYLDKKFPCLGAEVKVTGGQGILVCGDNNGYAGNESFEQTPVTVVAPLPDEPASPPVGESAATSSSAAGTQAPMEGVSP